MIKVGILIGSKTDLPFTEPTLQILTEMGIEHDLNVLSASKCTKKMNACKKRYNKRGCIVSSL